VPGGEGTLQSYPINSGPVKITSTDGTPLIVSQRINMRVEPNYASYTEFLGLPASQATDTYLFPWYNNMGTESQLRIGNVGTLDTIVTVTIGGVEKGSFALGAQRGKLVSYAETRSGPVEVKSSNGQPLVVSMRVNMRLDASYASSTEFLGLSGSAGSTKYVFPVYNNLWLSSQLRIANVGTGSTQVRVTIGGVVQESFALGANQGRPVSYAVNSGPVEVESLDGEPLVVTLRVNLPTNPDNASYTEFLGLPGTVLTETRYVFPWYNNLWLFSQLRIANVGTSSTQVRVTIGGVEQESFALGGNQSRLVSYAVNSGPVVVESLDGEPILATLRIKLPTSLVHASYSEFIGLSAGAPLGLPGNQLSDTYWFPFYNNVGLSSQLRFGVP
jgi:hypothetical protein